MAVFKHRRFPFPRQFFIPKEGFQADLEQRASLPMFPASFEALIDLTAAMPYCVAAFILPVAVLPFLGQQQDSAVPMSSDLFLNCVQSLLAKIEAGGAVLDSDRGAILGNRSLAHLSPPLDTLYLSTQAKIAEKA